MVTVSAVPSADGDTWANTAQRGSASYVVAYTDGEMVAVRVLRLMEYTYSDAETMEEDMGMWQVPPNGIKIPRAGETIRSSVITDYNFTPAEDITQGGIQDGASIRPDHSGQHSS